MHVQKPEIRMPITKKPFTLIIASIFTIWLIWLLVPVAMLSFMAPKDAKAIRSYLNMKLRPQEYPGPITDIAIEENLYRSLELVLASSQKIGTPPDILKEVASSMSQCAIRVFEHDEETRAAIDDLAKSGQTKKWMLLRNYTERIQNYAMPLLMLHGLSLSSEGTSTYIEFLGGLVELAEFRYPMHIGEYIDLKRNQKLILKMVERILRCQQLSSAEIVSVQKILDSVASSIKREERMDPLVMGIVRTGLEIESGEQQVGELVYKYLLRRSQLNIKDPVFGEIEETWCTHVFGRRYWLYREMLDAWPLLLEVEARKKEIEALLNDIQKTLNKREAELS